MLRNRGLDINEEKCLYEGVIVVIVPTLLYGVEACGMRSAERRKVNDLDEVFEKFGGTNGYN